MQKVYFFHVNFCCLGYPHTLTCNCAALSRWHIDLDFDHGLYKCTPFGIFVGRHNEKIYTIRPAVQLRCFLSAFWTFWKSFSTHRIPLVPSLYNFCHCSSLALHEKFWPLVFTFTWTKFFICTAMQLLFLVYDSLHGTFNWVTDRCSLLFASLVSRVIWLVSLNMRLFFSSRMDLILTLLYRFLNGIWCDLLARLKRCILLRMDGFPLGFVLGWSAISHLLERFYDDN